MKGGCIPSKNKFKTQQNNELRWLAFDINFKLLHTWCPIAHALRAMRKWPCLEIVRNVGISVVLTEDGGSVLVCVWYHVGSYTWYSSNKVKVCLALPS